MNALNPDDNPRAFLIVLVAAGLLIFNQKIGGADDAFRVADQFVAETERRFGRLTADATR